MKYVIFICIKSESMLERERESVFYILTQECGFLLQIKECELFLT